MSETYRACHDGVHSPTEKPDRKTDNNGCNGTALGTGSGGNRTGLGGHRDLPGESQMWKTGGGARQIGDICEKICERGWQVWASGVGLWLDGETGRERIGLHLKGPASH